MRPAGAASHLDLFEQPASFCILRGESRSATGSPGALPSVGGVGAISGPPPKEEDWLTFTQERVIPVERERLWNLLMDIPRVGRCIPGVEGIEAVDGGAYKGSLRVRIGPIRLSLEGTMTIEEQDRTVWRARMRADANDRRLGGGIRTRMSLTLAPAEGGTRLQIETDLAVLGKIGEFGQPVIKKKADTLLEEFVRNLQLALAA